MTWPVRTLSIKGKLGLEHCAVAGDGWILAGGHSESGVAFSDSGWVARAKPNGKTRWVHRTGSDSDYVRIKCLTPMPDGGVLVGGSRTWRASEDSRGFLLALSGRGKERWSFEFGQLESNGVGGALAMPNGGCLYARHEYLPTVPNPGRDDWTGHDFLCRVDAAGKETGRHEVTWNTDMSSVLQVVPWPGGLACLVAAAMWGEGAQDFPLVLLAAGGKMRKVELRQSEIAEPIAMASAGQAGGAILGGVEWTSVGPKCDPVLLRLGPAGEVLWERHYGDPETDMPTCLLAAPGGGWVLGGLRTIQDQLAVWITKTDARGEPLWERIFHSGARDRLSDLAVTPEGRILAVGSSDEPEVAWTLGLDADGHPR